MKLQKTIKYYGSAEQIIFLSPYFHILMAIDGDSCLIRHRLGMEPE
jgi:hypothetical protein